MKDKYPVILQSQTHGCWWPSTASTRQTTLNSLAPGRSECDSKNVIFNIVLQIGIFRPSHDNVLLWMPQDLTDDKSTLVQVMAWCRQATSHYLSQCWPRSVSPYGITRPQWVKRLKTTVSTIGYWSVLLIQNTDSIPLVESCSIKKCFQRDHPVVSEWLSLTAFLGQQTVRSI